jgi:hypothetical protein
MNHAAHLDAPPAQGAFENPAAQRLSSTNHSTERSAGPGLTRCWRLASVCVNVRPLHTLMTFRRMISVAVAVNIVSVALAEGPTTESGRHERWLAEHMNAAYAIKLGMTAGVLSKTFHHASAFAHPNGTYVYLLRACPLIRLDVTFTEITEANWTSIVADTWTIKTISKPYLAPLPND